MTSEWDDTPWAGSPVPLRSETYLPRHYLKAVTGAGVSAYLNDPPLTLWSEDPQARAKAFLKAYKCGWFYKAESKISGDLAKQPWVVTDGDVESEDPEETKLQQPDLDIPIEQLTPIDQFIRLMERPNPQQTGRQLRQKTFIRKDMAGWTFWYLETSGPVAPITAIYGISPSRLWPSRDKRTGELLGWVLDYDKGGGTMTFEPWEIVTFANATVDEDDTYGVGVVEAVYAELPLTDLLTRHTADMLSTGGRLSGFMWPRERSLDEDEFNDAQRAWRNVVSDANSARRLLLFPEPMEWTAGSSTPAEIGIPELAELNRDNILTAFPIAPEVLGVSMPAGQNASGETRRELYDWYWRGTIEPRSSSFDEIVQVKILSRYEQMMGGTFRYETELPDLDDASSLLEKAGAFKSLLSLGFDPKSIIKAVELDHIKFLGVPDLLDPAKQAQAAAEARAAQQQPSGPTANVNEGTSGDQSTVNIAVAKATKSRADIVEANDPRLQNFFRLQQDRVIDGITDSFPYKAQRTAWMKAAPDWWDKATEDRLLREALGTLYVQAARGSLQVVADLVDGIIPNRAVGNIVRDLETYGAQRITGINDTTLEAVQKTLGEGVRRGYGLDQIIDGKPDEGYTGLKSLPAFDADRAELVARTETMLSYNRAALDAYGEFGVAEVLAYDGDEDPECAERNGQTFSVEEALAIEDHPNGTLDWAPVTDKAYHEERDSKLILEAIKAARPVYNVQNLETTMQIDQTAINEALADIRAAIREQPAPVVKVAPTPPAPVVFARPRDDIQNVRIVEDTSPPKKKRVVRGAPTKDYPLGPVEGVE